MHAFDLFLAAHGWPAVAAAAVVLFLGGLAKGAVGFALPMIAISGLGAFLPAETAIALFVLPALLTNLVQSLRGGLGEAVRTLWRYRLLNLVLLPMIALCAQLLSTLGDRAIFMILGVGVTGFSLFQLIGLRLPDPSGAPRASEVGIGLIAGFFGGVSGVWGPPILLYLIARNTPPREQVRAMGISFLLGAATLTGGHLFSGVLDEETLPLSIAGIAPVCAGLALGMAIQDRMNARTFRRATLLVLTVAGLNLLRRALSV